MRLSLLIALSIFCLKAWTQKINIPFSFPIKPGLESWNKLQTENERIGALQVPDSLLKRMTTQALVLTCLDYPAFGNYCIFNNFQKGMDKISLDFNGLTELKTRNNAGNILIKLYKEIDTKHKSTKKYSFNTDYWGLKFGYFEMLLAQDAIQNNLGNDLQIELLKETLKKYNEEISNSGNTPSLFSISPKLLIMAKIIVKSNNVNIKEKVQKYKIPSFIKSSEITDEKTITEILQIAEEYLKLNNNSNFSNIQLFGSDYYTIIGYTHTPKGSPVTVELLWNLDLSQTIKDYLKAYYLQYYNNRISFISEATKEYNCHSYAWNISEYGPYCWINNENIYWDDGSYSQVSETTIGLKVSWSSVDHSAITTNTEGALISKWGQAPLFRHSINDSPYGSSGLKYYKQVSSTTLRFIEEYEIKNNEETFIEQDIIDKEAELFNNQPNPFYLETKISFYIPEYFITAHLIIRNMQGMIVKSNKIRHSGNRSITLNSLNLQAGIYLYTLIIDNKIIDTKKMILTRE
ncbi:MAG: T9SS type A sorting domain-containing protein [Salinivirgaceae bacterium]|nr:T9SS type A sorting domain-containing protein [Salinivirgaceae bacterium]